MTTSTSSKPAKNLNVKNVGVFISANDDSFPAELSIAFGNKMLKAVDNCGYRMSYADLAEALDVPHERAVKSFPLFAKEFESRGLAFSDRGKSGFGRYGHETQEVKAVKAEDITDEFISAVTVAVKPYLDLFVKGPQHLGVLVAVLESPLSGKFNKQLNAKLAIAIKNKKLPFFKMDNKSILTYIAPAVADAEEDVQVQVQVEVEEVDGEELAA